MPIFRCSALLFDLDGVLVDSTACIESTWRDWAARYRVDPATVLNVAHGRRALEVVRFLAPQLDAEAEVTAMVNREASSTEGVAAVSGARALLGALPPGRWAVVTSGVRAVAEHRLRYVGLPIPSVMICADEVMRGKPDPEGYLAAANSLAVAPEKCIVLEDAPAGVEAAQRAGMPAIALSTTYPEAMLAGANVVVPSLAAITVTVRPQELIVTVPSLTMAD